MDIPICQVINRMRQQVVVPQFGIEASRPLWPMHGHDESAFESSREALRVFDRLNLAQLIGQVFQRHAEPSGNGPSIELLGRAVGRQEAVWTATLLRLAVSVFAIWPVCHRHLL